MLKPVFQSSEDDLKLNSFPWLLIYLNCDSPLLVFSFVLNSTSELCNARMFLFVMRAIPGYTLRLRFSNSYVANSLVRANSLKEDYISLCDNHWGLPTNCNSSFDAELVGNIISIV